MSEAPPRRDTAPRRLRDAWGVATRRVGVLAGTLRARLTLAFIGCLALAIGGITWLSLAQVERDLRAQAREAQLLSTSRVAAALSQRVVDLQQSLWTTAHGLDPLLAGNDAALQKHLQALPLLPGRFGAVFVADADGRLRAAVDPAGLLPTPQNLTRRTWFQRVLAEKRPLLSEPQPGARPSDPVLFFVRPIVGDGAVRAVVGGVLRLNSQQLIDDLAGASSSGHDAATALVVTDAVTRVIVHPRTELLVRELALDAGWSQAIADWHASGSPFEPAGLVLRQPGALVTAAGVAGADWMVWQSLPDAALLAPIREARVDALLHAGGMLLLAAFGGWWWMGRLLRPLRRLERRATELFDPASTAHEDWPHAGGEIGALTSALRRAATERAALEADNSQLLARLSSVMAAAPLGIAITQDKRYTLVNRAWCRLLQREEPELLGTLSSASFASLDDYEQLGGAVREAFARDGRYEGEWRFRRKDGSVFWCQLTGQPVDPADPAAGTVWALADVTAQRSQREDLEYAALHDALTGVANRALFERRLASAFHAEPAALVLIDLDDFKGVNDRWGHPAGDAVLRAVALALQAQVRTADLVARLGGDEFAVLLAACPEPVAERIQVSIETAIAQVAVPWNGERLGIGASVGRAQRHGSHLTPDDWFAAADAACYVDKGVRRERRSAAAAEPPSDSASNVRPLRRDAGAGR